MSNGTDQNGNFTIRVRACSMWRMISGVVRYFRRKT